MSITVFANAGPDVGLGHLVRCLSLVDQLRQHDIDIDLWTPPSGTSSEFFDTYDIVPSQCTHDELCPRIRKENPQVVVLDSYDLSTTDIELISDLTTTVAIDELGDRRLPVDMIINNNVYADQISYPDADTVLRGPNYCMLREEFLNLPDQTINPNSTDDLDILLTIGGADLTDSFRSILETTTDAVPDGSTVHAVVGPYFDNSVQVDGVEFYRTPSNLSQLMANCDLAVSGGGQTLYELAVSGIPPVAVRLGEDQIRNIAGFEEEGFCIDAGWPDDPLFETRLRDGLRELVEPEHRSQRADSGQRLVDGNGAIRVADSLLDIATW